MNEQERTGEVVCTGLIDSLDARIKEKLEREALEPKKWMPLRPSAAGSCTRKLTFEMMEYMGKATYKKPLFTPPVYRLLELGSSIEYHVIKLLGMIEGVEIKYKQQCLSYGRLTSTVNPKISYMIEGSIDLCIVTKDSKIVADIKSKKDYAAGPFKTNWGETTKKLKAMKTVEAVSDRHFRVADLPAFLKELSDPFFEANFRQLNFYAFMGNWLADRGFKEAAIVQYNKNTSEMRQITFKPSLDVFNETERRFQSALDGAVLGDPLTIKRDYEKGHVVCRYCPFEKVCNKADKTIQKTGEEDGV